MTELEVWTKRLRLPYARENFEALIEDAEHEKPGYREFLLDYFEKEYRQRCENSIQKKIQLAGFPNKLLIEEFRRDHLSVELQQKIRELETLEFIDNQENIILVGNPGTGKSALSIALGMKACLQDRSVLFVQVPDMLIEIQEAMSRNEITRYRQRFERYDLVILDELGYCTFDQKAGEILFNLISGRNPKGSIIVTSNLPVTKWGEIFRDEIITVAMVDRLCFKAHMINMTGESYRILETRNWMNSKDESGKQQAKG